MRRSIFRRRRYAFATHAGPQYRWRAEELGGSAPAHARHRLIRGFLLMPPSIPRGGWLWGVGGELRIPVLGEYLGGPGSLGTA